MMKLTDAINEMYKNFKPCGVCPYCGSDNTDSVDSYDDSSKYICRDCDEDYIVYDDGTVTDRHGREIKKEGDKDEKGNIR